MQTVEAKTDAIETSFHADPVATKMKFRTQMKPKPLNPYSKMSLSWSTTLLQTVASYAMTTGSCNSVMYASE